MSHNAIAQALQVLAAGAHWTLYGENLSGLVWLDDASTRPTDAAILIQINAANPGPNAVTQ